MMLLVAYGHIDLIGKATKNLIIAEVIGMIIEMCFDSNVKMGRMLIML